MSKFKVFDKTSFRIIVHTKEEQEAVEFFLEEKHQLVKKRFTGLNFPYIIGSFREGYTDYHNSSQVSGEHVYTVAELNIIAKNSQNIITAVDFNPLNFAIIVNNEKESKDVEQFLQATYGQRRSYAWAQESFPYSIINSFGNDYVIVKFHSAARTKYVIQDSKIIRKKAVNTEKKQPENFYVLVNNEEEREQVENVLKNSYALERRNDWENPSFPYLIIDMPNNKYTNIAIGNQDPKRKEITFTELGIVRKESEKVATTDKDVPKYFYIVVNNDDERQRAENYLTTCLGKKRDLFWIDIDFPYVIVDGFKDATKYTKYKFGNYNKGRKELKLSSIPAIKPQSESIVFDSTKFRIVVNNDAEVEAVEKFLQQIGLERSTWTTYPYPHVIVNYGSKHYTNLSEQSAPANPLWTLAALGITVESPQPSEKSPQIPVEGLTSGTVIQVENQTEKDQVMRILEERFKMQKRLFSGYANFPHFIMKMNSNDYSDYVISGSRRVIAAKDFIKEFSGNLGLFEPSRMETSGYKIKDFADFVSTTSTQKKYQTPKLQKPIIITKNKPKRTIL